MRSFTGSTRLSMSVLHLLSTVCGGAADGGAVLGRLVRQSANHCQQARAEHPLREQDARRAADETGETVCETVCEICERQCVRQVRQCVGQCARYVRDSA